MSAPAQDSTGITLRSARATDLPAVLGLLEAAGLPRDGVAEGLVRLCLAEVDGRLAGVAGLERYGTSALLRSVAVAEDQRGRKVAGRLVQRMLEEARDESIHDVYLRTTTAEGYFPRFGFEKVDQAEVPEAVKASVEFQGACPSSAACMVRHLLPGESAAGV